jgi:hypothetical protein
MLMRVGLNKGNAFRVITSDDHVIDIENDKSPPTRRGVNKQCVIMGAGEETNNSYHIGEALKLGTRGLF